jgi:hypothetical protein
MVQGLRVVFTPDPGTQYAHRVPEPGTRGTVTSARVAGAPRTYLYGPGGGLCYVEWDGDGLVCAVTLRDLRLEPAEDAPAR